MNENTLKILITIAGIATAIFFLIWLGLRINPKPFSPVTQPAPTPDMIPLPEGLPAPVDRFYRQLYGENMPVITSAVLTGRGTMAPFGISIPMRFRFFYNDRKDYRAIIETTFYTVPFMKINETSIDGHAIGKLPTGIDEGEWFDDAMNVRVWCEILNWFPSALLTDARVRWEAFDEATAVLVVPYKEKEQKVIVRFDPQDDKIQYIETMKYRDSNHKILWINAVWFDQGKPWIHLDIEDKVFNVEVDGAIRE